MLILHNELPDDYSDAFDMFSPWEVFNAFFVDQNGMSEAMSLATKITSELSKKELEYFLIELMMVIKKQGIESMCKKCPLVDK